MLESRLRIIPLFRDLPEKGLKSIAARLKRERYPQGAVIFREGDTGDAMYLVDSGQLEVVTQVQDIEEDEVSEQTQAYLGPGSFVGEIALLLEQPRSATLKVVIDADLWVLHKEDLQDLLNEYPSIALHFTREIGQRLVTTSHQTAAQKKTRLTTVWGNQWHELVLALANQLEGSLGILPLPGSLPLARESSSLGVLASKGGVRLLEAGLTERSLTEDLSRQIGEFDHVMLLLPNHASDLARKALDLSDYTVGFGTVPAWIQVPMGDRLLRCDGTPEAVQRIARHLTDRTVGIALSSGGSRTIAHIGVMHVLRRAGIPVDMIGGTSGGALFGALIAAGWSYDKQVELARKLSDYNTFRNWDINLPPKAGLIRGRRARDLVDGWLEGRHFSDLEIPLYIVAMDLSTGEEIVFSEGPVADAVRASISIPGVADPWHYRDRFFIDGGFVNPMPASVLAKRGAKIIIGSSVVRFSDDPSQPKFEDMPHFLQIISRIISSIETEEIKSQLNLVDVLIHPSVFADHALDFSEADALVALGEQAARKEVVNCQRKLTAARVIPRPEETPAH